MKTSELIGPALDWAVAKCEGYSSEQALDIIYCDSAAIAYSTDWEQGGPIIERDEIALTPCNSAWEATYRGYLGYGRTPLIAAMRCYVASKLGDEIEIPEELK